MDHGPSVLFAQRMKLRHRRKARFIAQSPPCGAVPLFMPVVRHGTNDNTAPPPPPARADMHMRTYGCCACTHTRRQSTSLGEAAHVDMGARGCAEHCWSLGHDRHEVPLKPQWHGGPHWLPGFSP